MSKPISAYMGLFEEKLKKLKTKIKDELNKDKKDRNKAALKGMLREAKSLQATVHEVTTEHKAHCPHCGEEI